MGRDERGARGRTWSLREPAHLEEWLCGQESFERTFSGTNLEAARRLLEPSREGLVKHRGRGPLWPPGGG